MKYLFLFSKEDLRLAKEEALSLFDKKGKLVNNLLFLDLDNIERADGLAYTRKVYQFLFETDKKNLIKKIKEFDWQSIYKQNFCVRIHNSDLKEAKLASYIWKRLNNPRVRLINSKTSIEFFITDKRIYAA